MDDRSSGSGIYAVNECLIVPIRHDLDEGALKKIGKELLTRLKELGSRGVLIDVSAVSIMGSYGFLILKNTARAVEMMGATAVFVGFQPGVAASLVDLDMDFKGILTAVTTEDAFDILGYQSSDPSQTGEVAGESPVSETDVDIEAGEDGSNGG